MSFGGRSFKKEDLRIKRELQLLAKKSQSEFASLDSSERAAILEQSSKYKLHEKTKVPKKIKKDQVVKEQNIDFASEGTYIPPTPSIDLEAELGGRPESQLTRPDSVQLTECDRSTLASQKVASIKSKVDLNVIMQGKSIADGDRLSKASSIQSKPGQKATGRRPQSHLSQRSATQSNQQAQGEVPSGPKPAIITSQNSTMQIQLKERDSTSVKVPPDRSLSKVSKTRQSSAKSVASSKGVAVPKNIPRDEIVIPSPDEMPCEEKETTVENPVPEKSVTEEDHDTKLTTPIPQEDNNTEPTNEFDTIHSEILKMTQSLSFPDVSLMNLLSTRDNQDDISEDLINLTAQSQSAQALLQKISSEQCDRDFSIIGATKSVSPRPPQTPRTPATGRVGSIEEGTSTQFQSYGSPMKTISEAYVPSEILSTMGKDSKAIAAAQSAASREWTGLVTRDSNLYPSPTPLTEEKARQDLELSLDVKPEDVINIRGQQTTLMNKDTYLPVNHIKNMSTHLLAELEKQRSERNLTFLSTWSGKDKDRVQPEHNIHHFCTIATDIEVTPQVYKLTRDVHTPDRYPHIKRRIISQTNNEYGINEAAELYMFESEEMLEMEDSGPDERNLEERRRSLVAHRILKEAISTDVVETMAKLKKASDSLFFEDEETSLQIDGVQINLKDDTSRLYWTPAPPKMGLEPETVKSYLYPEYQGAAMLRESLGTDHVTLATVVESEDDEDEDDVTNSEEKQFRDRILKRAHGSLSDLSKLHTQDLQPLKPSSPQSVSEKTDSEAGSRDHTTPTVRFVSILDQRRQQYKGTLDSGVPDEVADQSRQQEQREDEDEEQEKERPLRRACSEPILQMLEDEPLQVSSDYDVSMKELNYQKDMIAAIRNRMQAEEQVEEEDEWADQTSSLKKTRDEQHSTRESARSHSTILDFHRTQEGTDEAQTETENMSVTTVTSRATAHSKMPRMPKMKLLKRRGKRKSQRDLEREQRISEFKMQPAHQISRSCSFNNLAEIKNKEKAKVSVEQEASLSRAESLPNLLDFNAFIKENSFGPVEDLYDWIREQYWYKWFDEVYPPSTASPQIAYDLVSIPSPRAETGLSKSSGTVVNSAILDTIQVIEPEINATDTQLYNALKVEVERLDELIAITEKKESLAMYLCRRGAVNRKIGELKKAWQDLNKAIEMESMLLDAYWHRHLLYLLQNNKKAALDDLTFIIKYSGSQARAYRSRAELYRQEGDATMAIVNYSQAVKLNPNDVETYYQRAEMFKIRGDMLLALEDYKAASQLLPSKTDAMFEIGIYRFNNENWAGAVNDFTEILNQDPNDSRAYTYRGRVYAKMGKFNQALRDLSAAIHYNPDNAVAFYHRGCILRKIHPRRALQDFSVSLLLDDSVTNVNAFMHRGILYTDLKRWEDAIPDFEAALQLDPTLASAHVNIGLIYIIKYSNYQKAIRQYTSAIRVDPTYVRALICRAEAYHKMGMLQDAVLDYARAIHMRPDVSDYHMARGKLLLEQKKLDLASFHVKQAAELNQGLGASATQQAVVQSFLKNFDQAIEVLERATRVKPSAQMFTLLGKTNMKAKRFEDAIMSFNKAIEVLTPWNNRLPLPEEAAFVYFFIGMCQSELHNYSGALDAFNEAIRVNQDYAEAFYHRGLTKMKLRHTKGVHDFNRALAINPKLFQAFLSRAAYYGMKGRFSKGIMSCNEAIKLQPQSVRAYLYRGALKYHIKAFGLAVKDLTEAVAIDCRCSLAYFNRAVCHHEMRYFQKALMDYGTVMLLENDSNLKVLQNRGLLYLEIGDIENALLDFKAAAKVAIVDPKIRHTLGLCYHKLNKLEEAVAAYDDALRIDPFFVEAYNGRGNALMDYGHEQGNILGRRDYLKALHLNPLCLSARVNLAYNLQVEGKFQAAWNQFSAAIAIDSTCQAALEGRAVINLQMRNTFGAFVDMNDALKISKTAELLNNRGVVQQYMGDYVNAVRDYQAAIRLDPSYALSYYNAGNVYFRQRQFKQALSYYNKALSWTLEDECAVLNRAITKVMLRDPRGAIQDFNRAVELNPYAAHVYFNRANLYASLRKYKEAEEDYTRALSLRPGDALVYKRRADVMGKQSKREAAIQDYKKAIIIKTRARAHAG